MFSLNAGSRVLMAVFFASAAVVSPQAARALPPGVENSAPPPGLTPPVTPPATSNPGPSQNLAAHQAQDQNNSSGDAAKAIGAALMAAGAAMMSSPPTVPMGAMLMALGALAMAQGGANKGAAAQHGYNSTLNASAEPVGAADLGGNAGTLVPSTMLAKELKKAGGNYDPKTGQITLPDGKSFNLNDAANQSAMANAGISADDFKNAMQKVKDAEKKAIADLDKLKTIDNGFAGGGGSSMPTVATPAEEAAAAANLGPRQPTSVAGMARNYNGDMIGVAGDDIFLMMARRYKEKASKESFLVPEAKPMEASSN